MRKPKIDTEHFIPYAGGYSKDGSTIYIDKRIPVTFTAYDGKIYPFKYFLIKHEIYEKKLMMQFGMTYNQAHRFAVDKDLERLKRNGVPIDEYFGHLHYWVELLLSLYKSGLRANIPEDLDLTPYIEDGLL